MFFPVALNLTLFSLVDFSTLLFGYLNYTPEPWDHSMLLSRLNLINLNALNSYGTCKIKDKTHVSCDKHSCH